MFYSLDSKSVSVQLATQRQQRLRQRAFGSACEWRQQQQQLKRHSRRWPGTWQWSGVRRHRYGRRAQGVYQYARALAPAERVRRLRGAAQAGAHPSAGQKALEERDPALGHQVHQTVDGHPRVAAAAGAAPGRAQQQRQWHGQWPCARCTASHQM